MGMKRKSKTEFQIMNDRLVYIVGKIGVAKSRVSVGNYDKILSGLGYAKDENGKWNKSENGCMTLEEQYTNQYILLCKKLDKFYSVLDMLKDEKLKRCAELRYCEGWCWKDIALELGETTRQTISYKEVLVKHFWEHDCKFILGYDT